MFTGSASLAGGALIGLSASLLLVLSGRVAGISGIVGALFSADRSGVGWRLAFLGGLLAGGFASNGLAPGSIAPPRSVAPLPVIVIAGLLVGFGTQLGGGCTSGHGVCGVSRLSKRSLVAVATFLGAGCLSAVFVQHVLPRL